MCRKFDQAVYGFLNTTYDIIATIASPDATDELSQQLAKMEDLLSKSKAFVPPTPLQVKEYAASLGKHIMGHDFCDFYESKGWMVGKNKMKSWEAAVRNWCKKDKPLQMPTETPEQRLKRMEQYL